MVRDDADATNVVRYKLASNLNLFVTEEQFRIKSLNYDNIWLLEKQ
jgi:hypothetical protein